jgi:TonB-dependent starch-binding outer membrane protein SusC
LITLKENVVNHFPDMTKHCKGKQKKQAKHAATSSLSNGLQFWRIMKLLNVFLFFCFLNVNATGYTQLVSINRTDANLEDILKEINRQTGFSYSSLSQDLNQVKHITIDVHQVPISAVLDIALRNQPFTYSVGHKIIVIKKTLQTESQDKRINDPIKIRGRIINEEGKPVLARIEVKGKGNNYGTITDDKGFFSIGGINEMDILVISGVNFNTLELAVGNKIDLGEVKVSTKVTTGQEVVLEVAHTGYETVKPNEATGSLVVISKKVLDEQFSTNVLQKLNGVASSVLFNSGKRNTNGVENSISVRGLSTINASTSPLIVLDENIFYGQIENINPNDVESITILKDAAATSIYGVGGANGVIVITSKRGQLDKKFEIDAGSNLNIVQKTDLYSQPMMSVSDYIDAEQILFNNGYYNTAIGLQFYPITPAVDIFNKRKTGKISMADSAIRINALKEIDSRDEYNKYFNSAAVTQQYYISLGGGSRNIGWLLSGGYDKRLTNQDASDNKVNLRFNNVYKVLENLSVTVSAFFTNFHSNTGKPSLANISVRNSMYQKIADENGNPLAVGKFFPVDYINTVGNGQLLDWNYYPLTDYEHDITKSSREQLVANINVNYKISKWLQLSASYLYQKERSESRRFADVESYYTRNLINSFTNLQATSLIDKYPIPIGGIIVHNNYGTKGQNYRIQANVNKSWNKNSVTSIFGSEIREVESLPVFANSIYGYRENPLITAPVNYRGSFRHNVYGTDQSIPNRPEVGIKNTNRFVSLYGNIAYTFDRKYSLSGSFRKDASNIFGVKANDKWNPLWSAGFVWDISQEAFYPFHSILPALKLRFTWGYSGNLDNSKTALPLLNYSTNTDLNSAAAFVSQPNNPRLKWEKSRQYNIALTYSLPHQRVTGSIEYYQKRGIDLYGETPYDYTAFGRTNIITRNAANLKTTGVDVSVDIKLFDSRKFKWVTTVLYNYNANVTTRYDAPVAADGSLLIGSDGNGIVPVVGKPLYALIAYRWGGLDANGNPQGYLNGHLSTDYRTMMASASIYREQIVYMGPSSPTQFGSLTNRIRWRGISVSFNISYRFGYYFLRPSFQETQFVDQGVGHVEYQNRWKKPGDELITNVPSFVYPYSPGIDFNLRDLFYKSAEINTPKADNIRFQYISASYNVPLIRKGIIKNIAINGNIGNLGIIWKATKEEIDPDNPTKYSKSKSFTVGLKIQL